MQSYHEKRKKGSKNKEGSDTFGDFLGFSIDKYYH